MDFLFSCSKEFSLDSAKKYANLLAKMFLVYSSTLVYLTVSSIFITTCAFYLKSQISSANLVLRQVPLLAADTIVTPNLSSNHFVLEAQLNKFNSFKYHNHLLVNKEDKLVNLADKTFCHNNKFVSVNVLNQRRFLGLKNISFIKNFDFKPNVHFFLK